MSSMKAKPKLSNIHESNNYFENSKFEKNPKTERKILSNQKGNKFFIQNTILKELYKKTDRIYSKRETENDREVNYVDNHIGKKIFIKSSENFNPVKKKNDNYCDKKIYNIRDNSGN